MSTRIEDTPLIDTKLVNIPSLLLSKFNKLTSEGFTLYPFKEVEFGDLDQLTNEQKKVIEIQKEMQKKYNFVQREAYDVLDDFDKTPDKLTDSQKVLRKKYLNIVLSLMDTFSEDAKKIIRQMIDNDNMNAEERDNLRKYALGNYEPAFNTIKRVINLLIKELDPNTTCNKTTCNKTPFIIAISILAVCLVVMIIAFIVSRLK
jgi:hypothetical protein